MNKLPEIAFGDFNKSPVKAFRSQGEKLYVKLPKGYGFIASFVNEHQGSRRCFMCDSPINVRYCNTERFIGWYCKSCRTKYKLTEI